eukprot:g21901.t1
MRDSLSDSTQSLATLCHGLGVSWTDIFHVQLFEPHVFSFYVEFTLYSFLLELHLTCYVQLFRRIYFCYVRLFWSRLVLSNTDFPTKASASIRSLGTTAISLH